MGGQISRRISSRGTLVLTERQFVLGIDTSCYTTSVAIVNDKGELVSDIRMPLPVPPGQRGLQQATAIFHHIQQLPRIWDRLTAEHSLLGLSAIVASCKPRPVARSYMPVFTVSEGLGRILAASLGLPFLMTSHQEGHIMAGLWSAQACLGPRFLAVHLSGGTSELLIIEQAGGKGFTEVLVGGTTDLHAGQFVDRVGVMVGLPFPAGPHLERLASTWEGPPISLPSSVKGYHFSFSGPESQARRYWQQGFPAAGLARAVEKCIVKTLEKVLRRAIKEFTLREVLIVGGVAANAFIRRELRKRLEHPAVGATLYFAAPEFSTDNAVGVALLGTFHLR